MLDKMIIRAMAEAERMMDEGTLPFVMAPSPNGGMERFGVPTEIMEDFGLKQGQTINTMIMDAVIAASFEKIKDKLSSLTDKLDESRMTDDFDFRDIMNDGEDDATRH